MSIVPFALLIYNELYETMNTALFFTLYNLTHYSNIFDAIVVLMAGYCDFLMIGITAIALVVFFVHDKDWKRRKWVVWMREVVTIGVAVLIPWLITLAMKGIFQTPRPFVTYLQVHPLVIEAPYTSFPSGHATVFFALAMVIYCYHKKLGTFFFFCAFLIAISRVIAGVHYPGDVITGAIIGTVLAYGVFNLIGSPAKKAS